MATFHLSLKIPSVNDILTILVMCGRHLSISLFSKDVGIASNSHDLLCIELMTLPTSFSVKGLN